MQEGVSECGKKKMKREQDSKTEVVGEKRGRLWWQLRVQLLSGRMGNFSCSRSSFVPFQTLISSIETMNKHDLMLIQLFHVFCMYILQLANIFVSRIYSDASRRIDACNLQVRQILSKTDSITTGLPAL
jgi:hypothetical protein